MNQDEQIERLRKERQLLDKEQEEQRKLERQKRQKLERQQEQEQKLRLQERQQLEQKQGENQKPQQAQQQEQQAQQQQAMPPEAALGAGGGMSNAAFGNMGGSQGFNPAFGGTPPALGAPSMTRETVTGQPRNGNGVR